MGGRPGVGLARGHRSLSGAASSPGRARTVLLIAAAVVIFDDHYLVRRGRRREPCVDLGIDHGQPFPMSSDAGWDLEERARDDPFHCSARQVWAQVNFSNLIEKDLCGIQASA